MRDPDTSTASAALERAIAGVIGAERARFVEATELGTRLPGDAIAANNVLLGYASQLGLLPVSPIALERAIELDGVAVGLNTKASLWGRRAAQDLDAVRRLVSPEEAPRGDDLASLVVHRLEFLAGYQNRAWAERYRARVEQVRAVEEDAIGGDEPARTVARYLFKLMACKDEYEVARLWAETPFLEELEAKFDGSVTFSFHLAPPVTAPRDARTGELQKRRYGP